MKILVCFKVIHDLEQITPAELIALRDGSLNISVYQQIFGSYDEGALETALYFADMGRSMGKEIQVHAITVGSCESRFVKNLYALGFDEVFCLEANQDNTWNPEYTAGYIAAFAKSGRVYDLILTGKQTGPGESARIPRLIARKLNLPCLSEVIELSPCDKGISALCKTDRGRCSLTLIHPAVCAIGEAAHSYLRVATLLEKLATASKELRSFRTENISLRSEIPQFQHYIFESKEKQCRMIDGADLDRSIHILWTEYLQKLVHL